MLRAAATPAPRPPPALPRRRSPVPADISSHPVQITDPRGVLLQVQTFDLLGRPLFTGAADEGHGATAGAGETRVAPDAAGAPLRVWRSGGLTLRHTHDALRRPIGLFVDAGAGERLVTRSFYGEALSDAPAHSRGRPVRVYDTAGELRLAHDFRGRVATQTREVLADVTAEADWSDLDAATSIAAIDAALGTLGALSGEGFAVETAHDALDRVTEQTAPDGSRTVPGHDAGGRLITVDVHVRGASAATAFISAIAYNARGQRTEVVYGNHTSTTFTYDPQRFWLARLVTARSAASSHGAATLQDLAYSRDRVGNVTGIVDGAQDTLYFHATTVSADQTFAYDALYRMIAATGREKDGLGQAGAAYSGGTGALPQAAGSMRQYRQEVDYDASGNIIQMVHKAGPAAGGLTHWRRVYAYATGSNQLVASSRPGESVTKTRAELQADPASVDLSELRDTYAYNARGALVYLPHLDASGPTNLTRDHHDQLRSVAVGTSAGTAHHLSDGAGIRVAKLWDKGGSVELRIWVGGYEVVRKASTVSGLSSPSEELHTLHVMDGDRRVAMVETYTAGAPTGVTGNRVRMQVGNHLGTACVETDEQGGVLTYEEFHPYGTTAWWSEKSGLEVSGKRYRYTGMERDEESGLQYHNARYYVPWLGRWDRADPVGLAGGWNRFGYAGGDPVGLQDRSGLAPRAEEPVTHEQTIEPSPELFVGRPEYRGEDLSRREVRELTRDIEAGRTQVQVDGPEGFERRVHRLLRKGAMEDGEYARLLRNIAEGRHEVRIAGVPEIRRGGAIAAAVDVLGSVDPEKGSATDVELNEHLRVRPWRGVEPEGAGVVNFQYTSKAARRAEDAEGVVIWYEPQPWEASDALRVHLRFRDPVAVVYHELDHAGRNQLGRSLNTIRLEEGGSWNVTDQQAEERRAIEEENEARRRRGTEPRRATSAL